MSRSPNFFYLLFSHFLNVTRMTAILALEDGKVFVGTPFGASGETAGEVVFNTSLTGYQEILTDPSYAGQIVVMTYPHIGNYGVNFEDMESAKIYAAGFVVRETSEISSNWRAEGTLHRYLEKQNIVGISDIDTRALVRHLREKGAMRGVISTIDLNPDRLVSKAHQTRSMVGLDLASLVTCKDSYTWTKPLGSGARFNVLAYDFGIKYNILRQLAAMNFDTTVVPAQTSAEDVLALNPDGVFLSNGPGDPEPLQYVVKSIKALFGKKPIFGICLGHQILGLAFGGKTYKLKFGHHGGNHPVKNLLNRKVEITAHNHGFAVDPDSLNPSEVEITHVDLNDHTVEGMRHRHLPIFSVQYHPEASPGPHDATYLFQEFARLMEGEKIAT